MFLDQENGDKILQENGGGILLETPSGVEMAVTALLDLVSSVAQRRLRRQAVSTACPTASQPHIVILNADGDHIYLESKLLKHLFDIETFTPLNSLYLAVSAIKPSDAHDGSTLIEPADSAYARIAAAHTDWDINASGEAVNNVLLQFPIAAHAWPAMHYLVLVDSPTSGNVYKYARITPPTVPVGTRFSLAASTTWRFRYNDGVPATHALRRVVQHFILNAMPTGRMGSLSCTLSTDNPSLPMTGLDVVEPRSPFTRITMGLGDTKWSYAGGVITNINSIVFPVTTDTYAGLNYWLLTTHIFGGYVTFFGSLASTRTLDSGHSVTIAPGEIVLRLRTM